MKVSIVIPAFNEERYIAKTLAAVATLTYSDREIIVVDNGSTDQTASIVQTFPDVILLKEERRGVQFARETGRRAATGDIIASLDADCIPPPHWLDRGLSYFKRPHIVAVSGPCDFFDEGVVIRSTLFVIQHFFLRAWHHIIHTILRKGLVPIGGNTLYRAETLSTIGGYNTSIFFHGDDTDTGIRLMQHGKIIYTPRMTIKTSGRRFKKMGILKTMWYYVINNLWMQFFQRPFHERTL